MLVTASGLWWCTDEWFVECGTSEGRDVRRWMHSTTGRWWRGTLFLFHPLWENLIFPPLISGAALFLCPRTSVSQSTPEGRKVRKTPTTMKREGLRVAQILFSAWSLPPLRALSHLTARALLNTDGWFSGAPSTGSVLVPSRASSLARSWGRNIACRTTIASVPFSTRL